MGAVNTTYTFTATDTITSTKMNNIIDQTTMTTDAVFTGGTIEVVSGKLRVAAGKITSNELANNSVNTSEIANNAVTQAKTNNMLVPAGAVMAFAMNSAPTGWLAANGNAISRTTYATLFAAIGTTYGAGNGSTTFNLPDLRGYFVRGSGTNSDGTSSGAFGAKQADEFKSHTHQQKRDDNFGAQGTSGGNPDSAYGGLEYGATSATGGSETRPRNIAMLYCIKL
jgi:microcystin-dependent protein